jgi:hypothetical protein
MCNGNFGNRVSARVIFIREIRSWYFRLAGASRARHSIDRHEPPLPQHPTSGGRWNHRQDYLVLNFVAQPKPAGLIMFWLSRATIEATHFRHN